VIGGLQSKDKSGRLAAYRLEKKVGGTHFFVGLKKALPEKEARQDEN